MCLAVGTCGLWQFGDIDPAKPDNLLSIRLADRGQQQLEFVRGLHHAATVAVVLVNDVFLKTAQSLLAPAIGERHALSGFIFPSIVLVHYEDLTLLRGFDCPCADQTP